MVCEMQVGGCGWVGETVCEPVCEMAGSGLSMMQCMVRTLSLGLPSLGIGCLPPCLTSSLLSPSPSPLSSYMSCPPDGMRSPTCCCFSPPKSDGPHVSLSPSHCTQSGPSDASSWHTHVEPLHYLDIRAGGRAVLIQLFVVRSCLVCRV